MLRSLLQEMGIPISQLHYSYTGLNAGASCVSADAVPISTSSYNQVRCEGCVSIVGTLIFGCCCWKGEYNLGS